MTNYFSSNFKLGILGGGQLGKMLLYDTRKFDIHTCVLDASNEAPAKIACNEFFLGDLMDYQAVYNFGKQVNILTIEIENVNVEALEALEKEGVKVYPASKTLRTIQNKAKQKLFYVDNDIPTASFSRFAYTSEIKEALNHGGLNLPFVWKCAQFGYDGTGVKIVKSIWYRVQLAGRPAAPKRPLCLRRSKHEHPAQWIHHRGHPRPHARMQHHWQCLSQPLQHSGWL